MICLQCRSFQRELPISGVTGDGHRWRKQHGVAGTFAGTDVSGLPVKNMDRTESFEEHRPSIVSGPSYALRRNGKNSRAADR